jgi:hypothetical protein
LDNQAMHSKAMILVFCSVLFGVTLHPAATRAHFVESGQPQDAASQADDSTSNVAGKRGTKRALIICGHPGDDEHQKMYVDTVAKLQQTLSTRYGFPAKEIRIQFGTDKADDDGPVIAAARGKATSKEIAAEVADLRKHLKPEDTLWVIVLGHAYYDGRHSWLNLPGTDIHEHQFGKLFEGLQSREQVFFITTPVSGFYIKPLSAEGRIVISATEADLEVNETLFHLALVDVLTNPPAKEEFDADKDGRISLYDLYIAITRNVANRYLEDELLSTEHAQLDDNGDGRSTELQLDYLTEQQGGRAKEGTKPPTIRPTADGALAIRTELVLVEPRKSNATGLDTE